MVGIDPRQILTEPDPFMLAALHAVTRHALELRDQRDQNLAILVGNQLARHLSRLFR